MRLSTQMQEVSCAGPQTSTIFSHCSRFVQKPHLLMHFVVRRTNTGGIWANYIIVQAYRFLAWF